MAPDLPAMVCQYYFNDLVDRPKSAGLLLDLERAC